MENQLHHNKITSIQKGLYWRILAINLFYEFYSMQRSPPSWDGTGTGFQSDRRPNPTNMCYDKH